MRQDKIRLLSHNLRANGINMPNFSQLSIIAIPTSTSNLASPF